MYSNKEHINILTALLAKHGVRHAVVCPGSRNAPIVHNLNECPTIACYPVTDERSAGFYALGMAQYLCQPVAVCVTSGTALLNLLPAVAEAYYQHVPLVVVSADRPPQWIGQRDGQTMPQPDALSRFVRKAVSLPEPHDAEERWHCNRLVNEAMLATRHHGGGPVHINVPISEPLYDFTEPELPDERTMVLTEAIMSPSVIEMVHLRLISAVRPMVVAGLNVPQKLTPWVLATHDYTAQLERGELAVPDFILYMGGTLVDKRLKRFLRQSGAEVWAVNEDGSVQDVLMNMTQLIEGDPTALLPLLPKPVLPKVPVPPADSFSQEVVVAAFEKRIARERKGERTREREGATVQVHYANSTAIRLAASFARHHVWCNRGVNGIEGSLSTAAGMSVVAEERVFCVVGDLSFFYDQNALWNQNLRGNLRILLLNNGGGGIFGKFDGLKQSAACDRLVMAKHRTTAKGICKQNGIGYRTISSRSWLTQAINWLVTAEHDRPVVLEATFE